MFKLIGGFLGLVAFSWSGVASAVLMPPVTVNGQQWLQPLDFVNLSWNDIASVCDANTGVCNGSLGGNVVTGWTWAGIPELNALFTSFGIPEFTGSYEHTVIAAPANTSWAPTFLEAFPPTDKVSRVMGHLRIDSFSQTAFGAVADNYLVPGAAAVVDAAQTTTNGPEADYASGEVGGWFYREQVSEVVTPATVPLLGLGLAALSYSRRKRIKS